jgi:serine/threonine-protein kinase ATR
VLFEGAISMEPKWEKGFYCYATYLDQLMRDAKKRQEATKARPPRGPFPRRPLGKPESFFPLERGHWWPLCHQGICQRALVAMRA